MPERSTEHFHPNAPDRPGAGRSFHVYSSSIVITAAQSIFKAHLAWEEAQQVVFPEKSDIKFITFFPFYSMDLKVSI